MRAKTNLVVLSSLTLLLSLRGISQAQQILINFDNLPAWKQSGEVVPGQPIPEEFRLDTQFLDPYGVVFTSGSPFVAVISYYRCVPSPSNYIWGTMADGSISGSSEHPITISFFKPGDASVPAVTDFVSVKPDPCGNGQPISLTAYDIDGNVVAECSNWPDSGGTMVVSTSERLIHYVKFRGHLDPYRELVAVDDLTFNTPVALNEPPVALCRDVTVEAGTGCAADASIDNGSYDPDGDTITITQSPPGPYPLGDTLVALTVTDSQGSSDYCTAAVTVVDASKPEITSVTPDWQVIPVGSAANFVVAVEDNCSCAETIWQFDVDNPLPEELGDCDSMSHIYASPGIYTVEVVAVDDAGNVSDPAFVHVVVYDPFGGFVTGGGWIWSPEGAFTDNPSAAGRADFGFISKYKKGTTVPTGQTEFTFQAGDLDFYSNNYEWLVVTGSNYARFKGTGTINGSGVYKFMLWARDGAPDTFRIKIWTESTTEGGVVEDVVYDNGMDQAISRGSIVVHTK